MIDPFTVTPQQQIPTRLLEDWMATVREYPNSRVPHSFYRTQLHEKMLLAARLVWLVSDEKNNFSAKNIPFDVVHLGSWYGLLSCLTQYYFKYYRIPIGLWVNLDKDPGVVSPGTMLCQSVINTTRFVVGDHTKKQLTDSQYVRLWINTITEHMTDDQFKNWLNNIHCIWPFNDSFVVIQGTNLKDQEHYRTWDNMIQYQEWLEYYKIKYGLETIAHYQTQYASHSRYTVFLTSASHIW